MLPKIMFRRSRLYDEALKRKRGFKMPSDIKMNQHLAKLEKEWKKWDANILREISAVTKLKWYEKEIVVYLSAGVIPYSDPLTINPRSDIHTLTHELIHRIVSEPENWGRIEKNWNATSKQFKNESQRVRTHIFVHAIHAHVLRKNFGEKTLKMEMVKIKHPAYTRAWEIVGQNGSENIIENLTRGLK